MRLLAVLLVLGLFVSPGASAQENESGMTLLLKEAGIEAKATGSRQFELQGQSLTTPLLFYFAGVAFSSIEDAETAMQIVPPGLQAAFSNGPSDEWVTVSAGDLGDERVASTYVNHAIDGEPIVGVVMARVGTSIVIGVTGGIRISPIELLVPYIESSIDAFSGADPQTEQEIIDLLPSLSDMPAGFAETADGDAVPGAEQSTPPASVPTAVPTAAAQPTNGQVVNPPSVFELSGSGDFTKDDIALGVGSHYMGLTCSDSIGEASIQLGFGGKVAIVVTSYPGTEAAHGIPYVATDLTDVMLSVECDGTWTFRIWKKN